MKLQELKEPDYPLDLLLFMEGWEAGKKYASSPQDLDTEFDDIQNAWIKNSQYRVIDRLLHAYQDQISGLQWAIGESTRNYIYLKDSKNDNSIQSDNR